MTDENVAFHDCPKSWFPFTVSAYPVDSVVDEDPVWTATVAGPGALRVPGLAEVGQRVRIVIVYADGRVERTP